MCGDLTGCKRSSRHQAEIASYYVSVAEILFRVVRIFHNLTGWKARLTDYKKTIQLASTAVHKESLTEQIKQAENKINELS